jgi:hypothetical protein
MAHKRSFTRPFALLLLSSLLPVLAASQPTLRLAANLASLDGGGGSPGGNVALPAAGSFASSSTVDLGPAAPSARLDRMLLLLAPPSTRQQALTQKLASLQNPSSSDYHHWLTASAFADSYANSAADVALVTAWLRGAGFSVAPLPAGRGWIEFSGTVSQVELAFDAQVHSITSGGVTRAAIGGSISIPAALSPLVTGLVSLDGSLSTAALTPAEPMTVSAAELSAQTSMTAAPALTPQLAARLLHLDSLHAAGTVGTGQTIGIAARSNVRSEDVAAFRATFGLAANPLAVSLTGSDPGLTADQPAAALLASWAGAAAPGAKILLVPAATTSATDGLDLSLANLVDQGLANTVVVGYSDCEAALSPAHQAFYAALYRQAAAQGISIVAAAGDSGAAACHVAGSDVAVSSGYAVNALAATPWNTAVGVAAFADRGAPTFSAWAPQNPADPAFAGGGGASAVQALPAWQPVPSSGVASGSSLNASSEVHGLFSSHRLLPDLALPTAIDAGLNPGLAFCLGGASGSCTLVRSGGSGAAAALVAGIAALIDQKDGAQGNLSPNLYRLANTPGVFADVAQGDALLRCETGTPDCSDEGQIGYAATPGYDLATGLGVVNAQALATNWAKPQATGTNTVTVVLTTATQTLNPSGTLTVSATVQGSSSVGNPTGTVVFVDTTTGVQLASVSPLTASGTDSATATTTVTATASNQLDVVESHVIAAQYGGDSNYGGDQSPSVTVAVALSPTTVVVTPASTSVAAGNSLAVQALVTASIPGTVSPTGTVTFNLDGNSQGTGTLVAGSTSATATTSVNLNGLTVGTHNLQGYYAGDKNDNNAYSPNVSITVTKGATTTTVLASTSTPTTGSSITFTATVAPTLSFSGSVSITGSVTFFDGTSQIGTATLSGDVATLNGIVLSTAGAHSITAVYAGDNNWLTSTSSALSLTVSKGATATTLVTSATNPNAGASFTLTATVAPNPAISGTATITGSVVFYDGTTQLGSATLNSNQATLSNAALTTTGAHSITAVYAGDSNWTTSTSNVVTVTVAKGATATTVVANVSNPTTGSPITFTATVAPNPAIAGTATITGTVTFYDGSTQLGVATLTSNVATLAGVSLSTAGTHSITAVYAGDTNWSTSTSSPLSVTVGKGATTTTLVSNATILTAGTPITFTATVAPTLTGTGTATVTGSVAFYDGTTLLGNGTLSSNVATLTGITLTASVSHSITAVYAGDTNWTTSTSNVLVVNVAKGTTVTTLTATPTVLTAGSASSSVTLSAAIAPSTTVASFTITGTVSFYDGTTLLGTATIASNAASLTVLLSNSVDHSITAVYSGDANCLTSTSTAVALASPLLPDTVTLTVSPTNPTPGQSVILTATVTPLAVPATTAEQYPTGMVTFYAGTTAIGTALLAPSTSATSLDSAVATLTISTLPGGTDQVSAVYSGDLTYKLETSNVLILTIQNFTITAAASNPATNLNIVQGGAGSVAYVITGNGGFNGLVQVVCSVPTQDDMTCTATPQDVAPPATVTFVVQTFTTGTTPPTSTTALSRPWQPGGRARSVARTVGETALALLGFLLLPFGKRARIFIRSEAAQKTRRFLVLLLMLGCFAGMGLGCSTSKTVIASGTPLGVATLTITASANVDNTVVSQSVYLTVNVTAQGATVQ